ncbi:MAG: hypothetical protein WD766_13815 [Gemmatimonadota bacterium]
MENQRDVELTSGTGIGGIGESGNLGTAAGRFDATGGTTPGNTSADGAGGPKEQVKETAREAKERATEEVESRISEQKYRAADTLGDVAESLRTAGQQLPTDNGMSRYMAKAANQVDNLASFLNNRDVAELVDDVEDFARRQPAAFIGGAFTLGVLGARFLKSSRDDLADDRFRDGWTTQRTSGGFDDPTHDAVARPDAPGYAPPDARDLSGDGGGGFR